MFLRLFSYDILKKNAFYDRENYHDIFSDPESALGKSMQRFILLCVLLGTGTIILGSVPDIYERFAFSFFLLDVVISLVFAAEYTYRFLRAPQKTSFSINIFNIIDLLSFAPFFLGLLFQIMGGQNIFIILRLLRVLRLFRISSHSPITLGFLHTIKKYRDEYLAIGSLYLSILVVISSFVYYFEYPQNPDFATIPDALWWGVVTMTTVGYGDMTPITLAGKLLGTIIILLGPVLVAVMGSITILVFMDVAEGQKENHTKICLNCKTQNRGDANFCYECGHQHFIGEDTQKNVSKLTLMQKIFSKKIK